MDCGFAISAQSAWFGSHFNHGGNDDATENCRGGMRGGVPAARYGGERFRCRRKLEQFRGWYLDTEPHEVAFSEYACAEDGEVARLEGGREDPSLAPGRG